MTRGAPQAARVRITESKFILRLVQQSEMNDNNDVRGGFASNFLFSPSSIIIKPANPSHHPFCSSAGDWEMIRLLDGAGVRKPARSPLVVSWSMKGEMTKTQKLSEVHFCAESAWLNP